MQLTILGSGTCAPSLKRGAPGVLIRINNKKLVFDTGTGTLNRLLGAGVSVNQVDLLAYTHIHPDHSADLVSFLFACNYAESPRTKALDLVAGYGFDDFLAALQKAYSHWLNPKNYRITFHCMQDSKLDFGDFCLITKQVEHSLSSIAYRIENKTGKSITISGDTDYSDNLIDLAYGTDILVLECAFPDNQR